MSEETVTISMSRLAAEQVREILRYQLGYRGNGGVEKCGCEICEIERGAVEAIESALAKGTQDD